MPISERCPNDLFRGKWGDEVLIPKPQCPAELVREIQANIPLRQELPYVLGRGDFKQGRSSEGSVALACGTETVVKVPVGKYYGDPRRDALDQKAKIFQYREISPPTAVIIARADGDDPKPIIVQRRIKGQPACETPIRKLVEESVLVDLKEIMRIVRHSYLEKNWFDLCGQNFSKRFASKIFGFFPFFSDNIVVGEGRAFLVDNIANTIPTRDFKEKTKRQLALFRLSMSEALLDLIILNVKYYNRLSRLLKVQSSTKAETL